MNLPSYNFILVVAGSIEYSFQALGSGGAELVAKEYREDHGYTRDEAKLYVQIE